MKVISPERERHPLEDKKYSKPVKTYSSCRGGVALFLDMAHPIKNPGEPTALERYKQSMEATGDAGLSLSQHSSQGSQPNDDDRDIGALLTKLTNKAATLVS